MALIIMMPLSMFLCATVSADVPTNGVSLLAIAMVLHYAIRAEKVTARDLAGLVAVFCALALVKQGYVLLTLLFFMIPSAKLGGRKRYALAALAVVGLPMLVELAWSLSVKPLYVPLREHVDLAGQIQFILRQPWKYCKMVIRSVVFFGGDVEGTRIYWDLIGVLGWQDVRLPWFVQSLYWTALAGTAIGDSQGAGNVTLRVRTGAVVVFGLGSVLLATSAFLSWTPKGLLAIMGLQARYWIPFAPLMLLPFVGLAAKYVDHSGGEKALPASPHHGRRRSEPAANRRPAPGRPVHPIDRQGPRPRRSHGGPSQSRRFVDENRSSASLSLTSADSPSPQSSVTGFAAERTVKTHSDW